MAASPTLQTIVRAAVTAVAFYYTFVFIYQGTIWVFDSGVLLELPMLFGYLLANFWVNQQIAVLFEARQIPRLTSVQKSAVEGLVVFGANLVVCFLTIYLPYLIIIKADWVNVQLLPVRVRMAFIVSSMISLFSYYFVERERSRARLRQAQLRAEQLQKENFRAQLELLKNQVDPHFLFNSLNVLNSLIHKDPQLASRFLEQLSTVYRLTLDNSGRPVVSLQEELALVQAYVFLMQTRFGNNLQFSINLSPHVQQQGLPPASLQMLIENAIKHNGSTNKKPLQVRIFAEDGAVVVENNLQPRTTPETSTKIGLRNIVDRYRHLSPQPVHIEQTAETFRVTLPLLPLGEYEDVDY
ncbi:sensor histidine kinase [Hymenobacter latericus]|uniref:sensor histidine kinase n=1 Tax=Hymenobacter sp. YIM 151858-1 TaxID=2987688 RepID=UPI002227B364|nr:histidine kinase [Hymenobacter sp. YIM 151858-1]UYZ58217.1 histidine kinase [Hymenobacter sp. YIM 151858-1]